MKYFTGTVKKKFVVSACLLAALIGLSTQSHAVMLKVTVTNNAQVNGLAITPVFATFHSASYDAFDVGGVATAGLKSLAELGMIGPIDAERAAADPTSVSSPIFPDAGMRPFFAGESGSMVFNIADPMSNMYFSFLSMLLPSNDTFLGRDDPLQIFDLAGNYLGNKVIEITGEDLWDAGTEALNVNAAPFVSGSNPMDNPADADSSIRAAESLSAFAGLNLANGQVLDASLIDFLSDPANFNVATIRVEQVSEPMTAAIFMFGLLAMGAAYRRRKTA
ncbi:spondin domain-containing protein [Paraglaciecola sp. L3A3]|uniref:spondin domain-containing protein n=1 Tax=Paraglaciecola sp. L3A3 TaxID=2686358 RepID=UPI00131B7CA1|nr:spondin domain-containing protein [Paraglaciecola sp. L3A3]